MKGLPSICLGAALLAGCATVDRLDGSRCATTADGKTPVETIQVMNTNWLLLSCIPIASGDPTQPNLCTCRWFRNTVTLENQMSMLEAEAARADTNKAIDVTTTYSDERVFFFLLLREKMLTSATLMK